MTLQEQLDVFSNLSSVVADMNYLAPMMERPRNYTFDPPPGIPRSNAGHEAHAVAIQHGDHLQAGSCIVVPVNPGNRQEVRHLPEEDDQEEEERGECEISRRGRPAHDGRAGMAPACRATSPKPLLRWVSRPAC